MILSDNEIKNYDDKVWYSVNYLLSIHFQTSDDSLIDSPDGFTNVIPPKIYNNLESSILKKDSTYLINDDMKKEAQKYIDEFIKINKYQYSLNSNITRNIWIIKPAGKSRGRGISVSDNYKEIDKKTKGKDEWIVQKYIEKPLIIKKHKFDIRVWVLVTDWNPLTAYIFDNCYLRFCSSEYDEKSLDNIYMHLSNNCIQKDKLKDFEGSEFDGLMWHIQKFKEYVGELNVYIKIYFHFLSSPASSVGRALGS